LHPAALAEVRARFGNDWLVETAAATSAATKNKAFDTYPYSQDWILTGLAKKDAVLVDDKPGAQQQGLWAVPISPFIVYKSIAVQASSASPLATTPQVDPLAPKVPPAGGFDFTNALLGAGAVALVGGVGWHLYSKKKRRK
jgi:hypothetical protein